jgi:hypothetical protein
MSRGGKFPIHSSLILIGGESIYRTDKWWKAVVEYQFEEGAEHAEVAVYLWHREDDNWTRKNKYVVKTAEAWADDLPVIERYLDSDPVDEEVTEFPVSDYYRISEGETIFKNEKWWKAIVHIAEKGSYETSEVGIYLWRKVDSEWRRRQKYAIKDLDDWGTERELITAAVGDELDKAQVVSPTSAGSGPSAERGTDIGTDLEDLQAQLERHLSAEYADD